VEAWGSERGERRVGGGEEMAGKGHGGGGRKGGEVEGERRRD